MTATVPETPTTGSVTGAEPFTTLDDDVDPDEFLTQLHRAKDSAYARELLGIADLIHHRLTTPHPDLDALAAQKMATGRLYTPLRGAVELTAQEYARTRNTDPRTATQQVWVAWTCATTYRPTWHAAAEGRITVAQAHTICNQASRLTYRTVTVEDSDDGDTHLVPGEPLLEGQALDDAVTEFQTQAIAWAEHDDVHGSTLRGRCLRHIDRMTPGWIATKKTTRTPGREAFFTHCDDGETTHVSLDVPQALARQLQCYATAAADRTVEAAITAGLHDPRNHATRLNDVLVDLLRHGLTQNVPAVSDHVQVPADEEHPVPDPRTHKPATGVQVMLRVDATTLFGTDTEDTADVAWVDGLGPVSPDTARELATSTGATWRKILIDPLTRATLDVGANTYAPSDRLRRFITARDQFCQAPGCHVPAADCEIDHVVPWPEGKTEVDNLQALCKTDHRYKTQFGWEDARQRRKRLARQKAARIAAQNPADDPPPF
jgi:hypothetical protein